MEKGMGRKVGGGGAVDLFCSLPVSFLFVGFPGPPVPQFLELSPSLSSGLSFFLSFSLSPLSLPFL